MTASLPIPNEPGDEAAALRYENALLRAELAETQLLLEQTRSQLTELSVTDPVTGLANRRAFVDALDSEVTRCRRYGHELTVVMVDIDGFGVFNDTYGHAAGDKALAALAHVLVGDIREVDMAARYGHDEFALMLPNTGFMGARQLAERIKERLAGDGVWAHPLSVSLGLGALETDVASPQQLIEAALENLEDAKRSTRD